MSPHRNIGYLYNTNTFDKTSFNNHFLFNFTLHNRKKIGEGLSWTNAPMGMLLVTSYWPEVVIF